VAAVLATNLLTAERSWRRLDGSERLAQVIRGVQFRDGEPVQTAEEQAAA
jgi:hypothetical protein